MQHQRLFGILICASTLAVAACQGGDDLFSGPPPAAASRVALDDILEPLRERPRREETIFFGDSAWAIDYVGGLFASHDRGQSWARVALPNDGRIQSMQFEEAGRLGVVVTEFGMMMRTSDAGQTWKTIDLVEQVRDGVELSYGGYFEQISFDASLTNGTWIDYCQIFTTSDGGKSWLRLADGLQDKGAEERCVADAMYDAATNSWFASVEIVGRMLTSGDYLFRSNNAGRTWREVCSLDEVGLLLESIQSCDDIEDADAGLQAAVRRYSAFNWSADFEALEAFSDQIDRGVFVSRSLAIPDNPEKWNEEVGLVQDSTNGRTWLSIDERLAYTDDRGEQWHVVSNAMPDTEYLDFSLGPDRGFAAFQYAYLAVSDDVGKTWKRLHDEPRSIYEFKVLPEHERLIVATETGLAAIDAETLEWRDVTEVGEATQIVVAGSVVWAFAEDGKVHRSTDAGDTWTKLAVNLEDSEFYFETAACTAEHCLLEGYEAVARLTTTSPDIDVTQLSGHLPDLEEIYLVDTILDAERDRGWIAMEDGTLHASDDGGRTWQEVGDLREELSEFRVAPGNANFIAWGYSNRYLWSSDGATFETRRLPAGKHTSIYGLCWLSESTALMSAYDERNEEDYYFASLDGGATWGPTDPVDVEDTCRVPGGLIILDTMVATVK